MLKTAIRPKSWPVSVCDTSPLSWLAGLGRSLGAKMQLSTSLHWLNDCQQPQQLTSQKEKSHLE